MKIPRFNIDDIPQQHSKLFSDLISSQNNLDDLIKKSEINFMKIEGGILNVHIPEKLFKNCFKTFRKDVGPTHSTLKAQVDGVLFFCIKSNDIPLGDIEELHHAALRMQKIILSDGTVISANDFMNKDGWIIQAELSSDKVFIYDPQYIDFEGREASDNG